jgi:hypothetical protein
LGPGTNLSQQEFATSDGEWSHPLIVAQDCPPERETI